MRLLVAADFSFDASGGGAAVARQALADFPGEIFWWSARRPQVATTKIENDKKTAASRVCQQYHFDPGFIFPLRRLTHLRAALMRLFWVRAASWHLSLRVTEVHPDKIWFIPFDWSILVFHRLVTSGSFKRLNIPFHVSIQDFPNTCDREARWGRQIVQLMASQQVNLYRIATSRDAISSPMLSWLRRRTGKKGLQLLHAGIEEDEFKHIRTCRPKNSSKQVVRIAYAGTIIVEPEFEIFVQHLDQIRWQCPFRLELVFWSAHSYRQSRWFRHEWMREEGHISEFELRRSLRRLDWGFIPMGLSDENPWYNRFSFPTKFITYLAAGLPVISLGHPQSSLMQFTKSFRVGIRCTSGSEMRRHVTPTALSNSLAKIRLRQEILRCGRKYFCANTIRRRFWKSLLAESDSLMRFEQKSP
jgi:hypothetical protein